MIKPVLFEKSDELSALKPEPVELIVGSEVLVYGGKRGVLKSLNKDAETADILDADTQEEMTVSVFDIVAITKNADKESAYRKDIRMSKLTEAVAGATIVDTQQAGEYEIVFWETDENYGTHERRSDNPDAWYFGHYFDKSAGDAKLMAEDDFTLRVDALTSTAAGSDSPAGNVIDQLAADVSDDDPDKDEFDAWENGEETSNNEFNISEPDPDFDGMPDPNEFMDDEDEFGESRKGRKMKKSGWRYVCRKCGTDVTDDDGSTCPHCGEVYWDDEKKIYPKRVARTKMKEAKSTEAPKKMGDGPEAKLDNPDKPAAPKFDKLPDAKSTVSGKPSGSWYVAIIDGMEIARVMASGTGKAKEEIVKELSSSDTRREFLRMWIRDGQKVKAAGDKVIKAESTQADDVITITVNTDSVAETTAAISALKNGITSTSAILAINESVDLDVDGLDVYGDAIAPTDTSFSLDIKTADGIPSAVSIALDAMSGAHIDISGALPAAHDLYGVPTDEYEPIPLEDEIASVSDISVNEAANEPAQIVTWSKDKLVTVVHRLINYITNNKLLNLKHPHIRQALQSIGRDIPGERPAGAPASSFNISARQPWGAQPIPGAHEHK